MLKRNSFQETMFKRRYFRRILLTNAILLITSCIVVGWSALLIFQRAYKETIHENMSEILRYNKQYLSDSIIDLAESVSFGIFNERFGLIPEILDENIAMGESTKVLRIHTFLSTLRLRNAEVINGIHIYYKKANIVISSRYGLKILDGRDTDELDLGWLKMMLEQDVKQAWTPSREVFYIPDSETDKEWNYSFLLSYPQTVSSQEAGILICLDFNEEHLRALLSQGYIGVNYILTRKGEVVSVPEKARDKVFSDMDRFRELGGFFIENIEGTEYLISYSVEERQGWVLINQYPIDELYRTLNTIQITIILIGLAFALIGIVFSVLFSVRNYRPVRQLVGKIQSRYSGFAKGDEEFTLIDRVFEELGSQVAELQDTITQNRGLLIKSLIIDLINNNFEALEDLKERNDFLDLNLDRPFFALAEIDIRFNDVDISHGERQLIKYRFINTCQSFSDDEQTIIATDHGETDILLLVNINTPDKERFIEELSTLSAVDLVFGANVAPQIVVSGFVDNPLLLHTGYSQIQGLRRFSFFMPEQTILTPDIIDIKNNQDSWPEKLLRQFSVELHSCHVSQLSTVLDSLVEIVMNRPISLKVRQNILLEILKILSDYCRQMDISTNNLDIDPRYENIDTITQRFDDILMFKHWLLETVTSLYTMLEKKSVDYSSNIIGEVKSFIQKSLDQDLSLNRVAREFLISPPYLSSLFKRESGEKYNLYITQVRINAAAEYLLESDENIDVIGKRVGYPTSHYFIKKFKEITGYTPKQFRIKHLLKTK